MSDIVKKLLKNIYRFFFWLLTGGQFKYEWRLEIWADVLERKNCDYINNCFIPHDYWQSIKWKVNRSKEAKHNAVSNIS